MEDGHFLYRQGEYKQSAHRFQYVIKKLPTNETSKSLNEYFDELKVNCLLQLCRCKRRMNVSSNVIYV